MKKLILILGIVLLAGCEEDNFFSFTIQRTDTLYHNEIVISVVVHEPTHFCRYGITKAHANRVCKDNSFTLKRIKVVSPIEIFGKVYPYYDLERSQICKIKN